MCSHGARFPSLQLLEFDDDFGSVTRSVDKTAAIPATQAEPESACQGGEQDDTGSCSPPARGWDKEAAVGIESHVAEDVTEKVSARTDGPSASGASSGCLGGGFELLTPSHPPQPVSGAETSSQECNGSGGVDDAAWLVGGGPEAQGVEAAVAAGYGDGWGIEDAVEEAVGGVESQEKTQAQGADEMCWNGRDGSVVETAEEGKPCGEDESRDTDGVKEVEAVQEVLAAGGA